MGIVGIPPGRTPKLFRLGVCSAMLDGAMMKRHTTSALARHEISTAASGMPKLCSHRPDEGSVLITHAGPSVFRPAAIANYHASLAAELHFTRRSNR